MEIGCQSSCGLLWVPEDIYIYIYIYTLTKSREPYQTVSTVYSLKKDSKERGAKNGEITYDELDFWAD